jgi:hypothetical protein
MKRQLFVTQLPMLFEQGTAQHRLRRKAVPSRVLEAMFAKIGNHQTQHITMLIQPLRHRLQFAADLVFSKNIEYCALDGAFLTHCWLRRLRGDLLRWNDPNHTQNRRVQRRQKSNSANNLSRLLHRNPFMDSH